MKISYEAIETLRKHQWPGNVRELENAIEHAVVMAPHNEITKDLLPLAIRTLGESSSLHVDRPTDTQLSRVLSSYCSQWDSASLANNRLHRIVDEILIRYALRASSDSQRQAGPHS
jgi:arginine utilization regulatory protein